MRLPGSDDLWPPAEDMAGPAKQDVVAAESLLRHWPACVPPPASSHVRHGRSPEPIQGDHGLPWCGAHTPWLCRAPVVCKLLEEALSQPLPLASRASGMECVWAPFH